MSDTLLYLYGLGAPPLAVANLNGVEDGVAVEVIEVGGVACVVSHVPAREYEGASDARNASAQLAWVTPRAWRHHEVLRHLHAAGALVPLKFGTLCPSRAVVEDMLWRLRDPIAALLERLADKDEWTLKIAVDTQRIEQIVQRGDPELKALVDEAAALPGGRAYFARKRLRALTDTRIAAQRNEAEDEVFVRLAECGVETLSVEARDTTAGVPVLVSRAQFEAFAGCLAELEAINDACGLSIEVRGPWPPYSFVATALDLNVSAGAMVQPDCRELTPAAGNESRTLGRRRPENGLNSSTRLASNRELRVQ